MAVAARLAVAVLCPRTMRADHSAERLHFLLVEEAGANREPRHAVGVAPKLPISRGRLPCPASAGGSSGRWSVVCGSTPRCGRDVAEIWPNCGRDMAEMYLRNSSIASFSSFGSDGSLSTCEKRGAAAGGSNGGRFGRSGQTQRAACQLRLLYQIAAHSCRQLQPTPCHLRSLVATVPPRPSKQIHRQPRRRQPRGVRLLGTRSVCSLITCRLTALLLLLAPLLRTEQGGVDQLAAGLALRGLGRGLTIGARPSRRVAGAAPCWAVDY